MRVSSSINQPYDGYACTDLYHHQPHAFCSGEMVHKHVLLWRAHENDRWMLSQDNAGTLGCLIARVQSQQKLVPIKRAAAHPNNQMAARLLLCVLAACSAMDEPPALPPYAAHMCSISDHRAEESRRTCPPKSALYDGRTTKRMVGSSKRE